MVWIEVHLRLLKKDEAVTTAFCEAVRRRSQTAAKLVALHLAREASEQLATLVDELLVSDLLLYAHHRGTRLAASAIEARWAQLDADQRKAVLENIASADVVSPSYADMRSLIAAVPDADRPEALARRLTELGGPRPASTGRDIDSDELLDPDEPAAARPSLAEQMATVPDWLQSDPVPWQKVGAALYEDARAQPGDTSAPPTRLLSADIAKMCAEAAVAAIAGFSASPPSEGLGEEVLHVADIALAFAPHHEDDELNDAFMAALRIGVFQPVKKELAVHALHFIRPWHWRRDVGHALLLEIIGTSEDPEILAAALAPIYHANPAAIRDAAQSVLRPTLVDSGEVAKVLGQVLAARAATSPELQRMLLEWLGDMPATGVLGSAAALNKFLHGAAFALKNVAHRNPAVDPAVYAKMAEALWAAWNTPSSRDGAGRHGLALFLMSPLHESERHNSIATRYWPALSSLFSAVLKSDEGEEVHGALLQFDLKALAPIALKELAQLLQEAARSKDRIHARASPSTEGRIAEVLRDIANHERCTRDLASEIHQTLIHVGARKEVLEVERRLRDRSR